MEIGAPYTENTCSMRAFAIVSAFCFFIGTITGQPENASMATSKYLYPSAVAGMSHTSTCQRPWSTPSWKIFKGALPFLIGPLYFRH
ncbi:Cytochrome P450 monooxygenase andK, partial [Frankliniella fusca]